MNKFENKACPKIPGVCIGVKCIQFASCMRREIEALNYMGLNKEAMNLGNAVCDAIKESLK